jgi:hypothetical protein
MKQRVLSFLLLIPFCSFAAIYCVKPVATGSGNGLSWANATTLQNAINLSVASGPADEIWIMQGTYIPTSGTGRYKSFTLANGIIKLYGGFNGTETLLTERNPKLNVTVLSGDLNGDDNATITATEATRQDNAYHVITVKNTVVAATTITIDGCTITGGNANGPTLTTGAAASQYYHTRGGAIYIHTVFLNDIVTVQTTNCIVEKNSASDTGVSAGYTSGGITDQTYTTNFDRCIIRNNYSGTNSAIIIGGANGYRNFGVATIVNCLFHNNTSTSGASCLYAAASTANGGDGYGISVMLKNNTFTANSGVSSNVFRTSEGSGISFINNIIYGNGGSTPFNITGSFWPAFDTNTIQGVQIPGQSNVDPLLKSDFTLNSGSPAIDAGNTVWVAGISLDLAGNARVYNSTVDKGCYEYNPALSTSDFNSFSDFIIFPNPATEIITVKSNEDIEIITILSLEGRNVKSTTSATIDVSDLSNGIYLMQVKTTEGKMGIKKMIKQ